MVRAFVAAAAVVSAGAAAAQPAGPPSGWFGEADAAYVTQPRAGLDGGGAFSASRSFVQATQSYGWGAGNVVGLTVGVGRLDLKFSDGTDFALADGLGGINDYRLSVPLLLSVGARGRAILVPSLRFNGEEGVDFSDGDTAGLFAGYAWRLSPTLTIGPGFGFFSSLSGGTDAFPILLIDWRITDRLTFATGGGLGASQGPGLTLSYAVTDALSLGVAGRYESAEFRLDDDGPVPGGIGQDEVFPLVATAAWNPNPQVSLSAFAGVELEGTLTIRDSDGGLVERRDYDPVPVMGASVRLRF